MITLVASDFESLEESASLWRWTEPRSSVLPHSDVAQIPSLKREKAQALWESAFVSLQERSRSGCVDPSGSPTSALFVELQQSDISHQPLEKRQPHVTTLQP